MIFLNGKCFAANEAEFKSCLFEPHHDCVGYYRVNKKSITLKDHNKIKIGVICNLVCAAAVKLDNGKWFYSYSKPALIGEWPSYSDQQEEISAITSEFNLAVRY